MMKGSCGRKREKLYKEGRRAMLDWCSGLLREDSRTRTRVVTAPNRSTKRRRRPPVLLRRRSTCSGPTKRITGPSRSTGSSSRVPTRILNELARSTPDDPCSK